MRNDKTRFEANAPFALDHLESLRASYRRWTGKDLVPPEMHAIDVQGALFDAPFALLSHGPEPDPVFDYGNRLALRLFEMQWDEFLNMPSRFTTDPAEREERQRSRLEKRTALSHPRRHGMERRGLARRLSRAGRLDTQMGIS